MDLALNNLQWLIYYKTKPNHLDQIEPDSNENEGVTTNFQKLRNWSLNIC